MNVDVSNAEKIWKKALKLLEGECPTLPEGKGCEWCERI